MERKGFIYKITSPTGRVYIGKTINLSSRKSSYRINSNKKQRIIYNSIKKYGWDNHVFEIIDEAPASLLNELEIKHIKELNSFHHNNKNGMNLTRGGEGTFGRKDSKEVREKRAKKHLGSKRSDETKKLMSLAKLGKPSNKKGWKAPPETIKKNIEYATGRKQSNKTINKRLDTKLDNMLKTKGAILQINLETNEIVKEWKILPSDLARKLKCDPSGVLKAIKGLKKHYIGYAWRYKNIN